MLRNVLMAMFVFAVTATASAATGTLDDRRGAFRSALHAAERGNLKPRDAAALADHPLAGWLQYAALRHDIAHVDATRVRDMLRRYDGQPVAATLRSAWLGELLRRRDWVNFRTFYAGSSDPRLRCADLAARLVTATVDAAWINDATAIWRDSGMSLPNECDAPFLALTARNLLTPALRWARIERAAAAGNSGIMRVAARGLPPAEAALATDYAAYIDAPHTRYAAWPKTARSRQMAALGLARLATRDADAAQAQLPAVDAALQLDDAARGRVLYQIALWTVASYAPHATERLNAVPADAYDARLHEWRVREAMARGDDGAALAAIETMDAAQRGDSRWTYFEARLRERDGQTDAANALYARAAREASFHGFLAADRLARPYSLCPLSIDPSPALRREVQGNPGLVRAFELFALERPQWATSEWNAAVESFDPARRRIAVALAQEVHWYDRAVFGLGTTPDDLRLYALRFPLHHTTTLRREARKHRLDPALVAADIRAESAFMPRALSPANARGLMQLLPGTAQLTAKRQGLTWTGADSLYHAATNLRLGTAHLRHEIDQQGAPYMALAAYNAGPTPVARWRAQRPGFDPDFWIETITYRETREYVARVLAFSVIYDWRLGNTATSLRARMRGDATPTPGDHDTPATAFACPDAVVAEVAE